MTLRAPVLHSPEWYLMPDGKLPGTHHERLRFKAQEIRNAARMRNPLCSQSSKLTARGHPGQMAEPGSQVINFPAAE